MSADEYQEEEFSFISLFTSLTTYKAITLIIFVGLVVYFNSLFGEFVWDDIPQVVFSPLVTSLSVIPEIFSISQVNIFYRPFFLSYLTIVNVISHGNVFFFHIFQLGMHIINAILVFLIFRKYFKEIIALVLSLIFLVHPINVEAVSYISAVSDVIVFSLRNHCFILVCVQTKWFSTQYMGR